MKRIVLFMVFVFTCLVAENFDANAMADKLVNEMLLKSLEEEWKDYINAKEKLKKQGNAKVNLGNFDKLSSLGAWSNAYTLALFASTKPKTGEEYLDIEKIKKVLGIEYEVRKFYQQGDNELYIIKIHSSLKDFVKNFKLEGQQKAEFERTLYGLDKKIFSEYEQGKEQMVKLFAFLQFHKIPLTSEMILYAKSLFRCFDKNVLPLHRDSCARDYRYNKQVHNLYYDNPIFMAFRTRYGELQKSIKTADFDWAGKWGWLDGDYLKTSYYHTLFSDYCYGEKYDISSLEYKIEVINKINEQGRSDICKAYYDNYEWVYDGDYNKEVELEYLKEALEKAFKYNWGCTYKPSEFKMPIFYGKNAEIMTCGEIREKLDSLQENNEQKRENIESD